MLALPCGLRVRPNGGSSDPDGDVKEGDCVAAPALDVTPVPVVVVAEDARVIASICRWAGVGCGAGAANVGTEANCRGDFVAASGSVPLESVRAASTRFGPLPPVLDSPVAVAVAVGDVLRRRRASAAAPSEEVPPKSASSSTRSAPASSRSISRTDASSAAADSLKSATPTPIASGRLDAGRVRAAAGLRALPAVLSPTGSNDTVESSCSPAG
jgi:hypothetical protein